MLGLALALLACLPFLAAAYPQMTDYPSHLARWHVMLDQGHSAWLARYYSFEWRWNGNLGADLLIWPFARVFGLELGGRMIGAIVPVLTGLGLICVEWTLRRRVGVGALLAFATIWSPMFNMGLLNFGLALALALFAFALWVRLEGWRWRWAVFVPLAFAVWLCHVAGWGVLGLLVLSHELHRRVSIGALLAPWPLAFPLLAQLQTSGSTGIAPWGTNVLRYKWAMWNQALRDQSHSLDTYSLLFLLLAIVAAAVLRKLDRPAGLGGATVCDPDPGDAAPLRRRRLCRHAAGAGGADDRLPGDRLAPAALDAVSGAVAVSGAAGRNHRSME